jgi:uncharacterized protein (DUF983 family)
MAGQCMSADIGVTWPTVLRVALQLPLATVTTLETMQKVQEGMQSFELACRPC